MPVREGVARMHSLWPDLGFLRHGTREMGLKPQGLDARRSSDGPRPAPCTAKEISRYMGSRSWPPTVRLDLIRATRSGAVYIPRANGRAFFAHRPQRLTHDAADMQRSFLAKIEPAAMAPFIAPVILGQAALSLGLVRVDLKEHRHVVSAQETSAECSRPPPGA